MIGTETTLVVDDQEYFVLVAGLQHALGVRQAGGNGFFAIDDGNATAGTGDGYFGMIRCVGGDADDIDGFSIDHVTPVGIHPGTRPRFKTLPSPSVPARPGDELNTRIPLISGGVGAIHFLHPLPQRITRDLIGPPDHSQANDRGSIGFVDHAFVGLELMNRYGVKGRGKYRHRG